MSIKSYHKYRCPKNTSGIKSKFKRCQCVLIDTVVSDTNNYQKSERSLNSDAKRWYNSGAMDVVGTILHTKDNNPECEKCECLDMVSNEVLKGL
jgi:hypothetical protein